MYIHTYIVDGLAPSAYRVLRIFVAGMELISPVEAGDVKRRVGNGENEFPIPASMPMETVFHSKPS